MRPPRRIMDAHMRLKCKASVIGSASDFAFKWSLNVGLGERDATRFALAVDEVITDVVLYAFPDENCEFEVIFRSDLSTAEVVVRELGEPFDPDRHRYDSERALATGDFQGAGVELVRRLVDDFVFLNKGKAGKEFRIVKRITNPPLDIIAVSDPRLSAPPTDDSPESYTLHNVTADDAEEVAKLIFRTYGYSYANEDMYHPKRIELGFQRDEKFGVIARTSRGDSVGYFAVLRQPDSAIGEVAEVMVSPGHRCKGLMTRMLGALVERARAEKMEALFGEAVAVHDISQRVNHKHGFQTTALMLAAFPITRYRQLIESFPEDMSAVVEFLILEPQEPHEVYLPHKYRRILRTIYDQLGIQVEELHPARFDPAPRTRLDVDIAYHNNHAVLVVQRFGSDFDSSLV
ncbi:MAG TPA: GNAT family N-acetyltransferase, partial [Chromatiales bacterium]|nr:GNAT family N-acetyltransferase [Chromatiales bacterium]